MNRLDVFHKRIVTPQESLVIFEIAKNCLQKALLQGESIDTVRIEEQHLSLCLPLEKALGKILGPLCTQEIGGFETDSMQTKEKVVSILQNLHDSFDGLFFGIEASQDSILDSDHILNGNCIVYGKGTLSQKITCRWDESSQQKASIHRYTHNGNRIYIGHMRSGTMEPKKAFQNRIGLEGFTNGVWGITPNELYDLTCDVSFWDANFDVTDSAHLRALCDFSEECPVQIVFPRVRVKKKRIANRPFANNQVHKGGKIQNTESMVAIFPKESSVDALDEDGLFVIRGGKVFEYGLGISSREVLDIEKMVFREYRSFSTEILLDHKPLLVCAAGTKYQFHNFMDFGGSRGFSGTWYDPIRLKEAEDEFVERLLILLLQTSKEES
jgi:hypothetical protein